MNAVQNSPLSYRSVPGPKAHPILGNVGQYREDTLGFERLLAKEYGDIVHIRFLDRNAYLIFHPDDIRKVLVEEADKYMKAPIYQILLSRFLGNGLLTSDGDFWKRQRKLSQPAFHTKRIQAYAETMVDYTKIMLDTWTDGQVRDMNHEMTRLTLSIVVKSLFNAEIGGESDRIGEALTTVLEASNEGMQSALQMVPEWVPLPRNIRNKRGVRQLDEIIMPIINSRKGAEDNGDLLSMLLLAEDEDGNHMTDKQLRDEVVTLVLAGHETTANALTWAWYLLSQHPEIEAKLHEEVDRVLGDRLPTLADLRQLEYTQMVFKEAIRLYPPIPSYARQSLVPVELGGYTLPAGSIILISPHVFHKDARWWDEPEAFKPERFSKENEKTINKYAYLPFGGGPRICIGNSFAEMEAVLLLATIAQHYRMQLDPADQEVVPEPTLTLRPRHNLMMRLEKRQAINVPAPMETVSA
ncbi:MAG: cytochrome P450 [Chloroflexota bacterium]